jgi:2,3-bisphosphoglycerate-independent phosphoglycerate mutase
MGVPAMSEHLLAEYQKLLQKNDSRIVLMIMDGVGGIRTKDRPKTELELAKTPNLDALAKYSALGRSRPAAAGITPGSGPGHLGVFGYNPMEPKYEIGRGVLEALGIDFDLKKEDVAARANFCTLAADGTIKDRRAGRIPSDEGERICKKMQDAVKHPIEDVEVIIEPVKEYRFCVILRGADLGANIPDTDPQQTGVKPHEIRGLDNAPPTRKTVRVLHTAAKKMFDAIKDELKANGFTLRGIAKDPGLQSFEDRWGLKGCAIASYPLYRGVAKLLGMDVLQVGSEIADEFELLKKVYGQYDFYFIHIKKTDSYGEDGNPEGRIKIIEEVDKNLPALTGLNPDVIVVTGDHSTPPPLKSHSWHAVPLLIHSAVCDVDATERFTEAECDHGTLGRLQSTEIMPLALANAGRLIKFGA